jgi:serine protease Do
MKAKSYLVTFITAVVAALLAVLAYSSFNKPEVRVVSAPPQEKVVLTSFTGDSNDQSMDFTFAAEKTVHGVVSVKTKSERNYYDNPFSYFFGNRGYQHPEPVSGLGSGVIISNDGYIVTNNHVIDGSNEIEVVLNDKRAFPGKIIGADKSTDIAVIKIDAKDLSVIPYGNSDDLKLGQWVLAVGNPYALTSTVTAGIVSAKGRNIGINETINAIESFIQTDAAVNPGNSGGALVNTKGELVGMNTALYSQTGSYSGNSFAIPVNILKKVVSDILEFGAVQRAVLGVSIKDLTQEVAKEHNIDKLEGVYLEDFQETSAARDAGMKKGDVILSINSITVNSVGELQAQISKYRPNDKVNVLVRRDGKEKAFDVTLRNMSGNTGIVKPNESLSVLGANFEDITAQDKRQYGIRNGVRITSLSDGKLKEQGIKVGFIITKINHKPVTTVEDIKSILSNKKGAVLIEGVYPDGSREAYAIVM